VDALHLVRLHMKIRKFGLALAALFALTTGYTSDGNGEEAKREYAVPGDLCEIDVTRALYEPLFPPGSNLQVVDDISKDESGNIGYGSSCVISVDDSYAITVDTTPSEEGYLAPGVEHTWRTTSADTTLTWMRPNQDPHQAAPTKCGSGPILPWHTPRAAPRNTRIYGHQCFHQS
jgi:hypothetical protein